MPALLKTLQRFEELSQARLVHVDGIDGSMSLVKRKVLDASGQIVSDDREAWFAERLAADGGNASATYRRLAKQGLVDSRCGIHPIYLVVDRGGVESSLL